MGHAYFQFGLCPRLHAVAAVQAKDIWHSDSLDFDGLPYFEAHRAAFKLKGGMALVSEIVKGSPSPGRANCDLFQEAFVRLE